jgi:predicted TIM-barrel fold metal-dependent hydrolase
MSVFPVAPPVPGGLDFGQPVIDTDIHCTVPNVHVLFPYLNPHWREYITTSAFKGPTDTPYPSGAPTSALDGTRPENGPPGSSLALIQEQVLDAWNVEVGILNPSYAVDGITAPDTAAAMARAFNDWMIEEWLAKEPRLRATMLVPTRVPEMAAAEIDRIGSHPGIVQVMLPVVAQSLYGQRRWWPLFEAIARNDLVASFQFGGASGFPMSAAGWPSHYIEEYVDMAAVFQSHLLSMVSEGLLDKFPTMRIAMIESGWSWLPAFFWRFDKVWKGLRRETPWVRDLPSEYIKERMRFSLQPLDLPRDPVIVQQIMEQLNSDSLLMFSTDYPHWHFDTPEEALPAGITEEQRTRILYDNAARFYRLGRYA